MKFDEMQIPPPKNWQTFEDLCLSLFKKVWGDPLAQKNGRLGQAQAGTDVSGRPTYDAGAVHGVQAKGKDRYDGAVTEKVLREEVAKALTFKPSLKHWVLATTGKKDAAIEELARTITKEHEATGGFVVQVLAWDDLLTLMNQHPSVIEEFYPEQTPIVHRLERALAHLAEHNPAPDAIQKAAAEDLEAFVRQHNTSDAIDLSTEIDSDDGRRPIERREIAATLLEGASVILEAEPGAGKSTTLIQVAKEIQAQAPAAIPIVIPLIELSKSEVPILDDAFSRPRFNGVSRDELLRLANEGAIIFLCDGWNELLEAQRIRLLGEFKKLRRDFPKSVLLVATRAIAPILHKGSRRAFVLPLTRAQQLDILTRLIGDGADTLLTRVRRQPGLRSIIRIPLYLNALSAFEKTERLPETKEEVLRKFVDTHDNHSDHRDALLAGLNRCHAEYLRSIAAKMTEEGVIALPESTLRKEITAISERLASERHFKASEAPNSNSALDTLIAHHILVHWGEQDGERLYGFQHQQFLEWYASFQVEQLMMDVHEAPSDANKRALDTLLDRTDIPETLQFAIERLSRREGKGAAAGTAILRALRIDLQMAAALIRRVPDAVWLTIKDDVTAFARPLLGGDQHERIVRFMGATGKPDFAEFIWADLTDKNSYNQHTHLDRDWLRPNSLGPDANKRLVAAPADLRRAILWDFVAFGGQDGIDFAIQYAPSETDPKIVADVVHNLEFSVSDGEASELLDKLTLEAWKAVALVVRSQHLPPKYRHKVVELKWERAATLEKHDRYYALVDLAHEGETVDGTEMVALVLENPFKEMHAEYRALEFLHERFPKELEAELARRISKGEQIPYYASRFAAPPVEELQDAVLQRALAGRAERPADVTSTARALNQASLAAVLAEYMALGPKVHTGTSPTDREAYERRNHLLGILTAARFELVFGAVLSVEPKSGREVTDLTEIVMRWQDDDRDRNTLPLDAAMADRLVAALEAWGAIILSDPEGQRSHASHFVSSIKRVGDQRLFELFKKLMAVELGELEKDRKYREQWQATKKQPQPVRHMVGFSVYQHTFNVFQGDGVRDFLLSLLDNPSFELEAAFELRRFGTSREIERPGAFHGTRSKFDRLQQARKSADAGSRALNPVAAAVIDRIERHLAAGTEDDLARARAMAGAAVQMDYGSKFPLIASTIEKATSPRHTYNLLEIISALGLPLKADWVRRGFEDELSEYNKAKWHNQNDFWVLRRWIELLALSTDPEQVADAILALPETYRSAYNFHEVIYALGYSNAPNATKALIKLSNALPGAALTHDFLTALTLQDSAEGAEFLLNTFSSPDKSRKGHAEYDLNKTLTHLLSRHSEVKARYLSELKQSKDQARHHYASILPGLIASEDVMTLLGNVAGDDDPLAQALVRAASELAIMKKYGEDKQSYEIHPTDLKELRNILLPIAASDRAQAGTAYRMLIAIENAREEHGRPATEPHHPNIDSGIPWPLDLKKLKRG